MFLKAGTKCSVDFEPAHVRPGGIHHVVYSTQSTELDINGLVCRKTTYLTRNFLSIEAMNYWLGWVFVLSVRLAPAQTTGSEREAPSQTKFGGGDRLLTQSKRFRLEVLSRIHPKPRRLF